MEPPWQQRGPRGFGSQFHATDGTEKAIWPPSPPRHAIFAIFCFCCLLSTKAVTPNLPRPLCFTSVYWMFKHRNDLDPADASWSRGHSTYVHFALSVRSAYVLKLALYIIFTDMIRNELRYHNYETGHASNTHAHRGRKLKTEEWVLPCISWYLGNWCFAWSTCKTDTYSPVPVELRTATVVVRGILLVEVKQNREGQSSYWGVLWVSCTRHWGKYYNEMMHSWRSVCVQWITYYRPNRQCFKHCKKA